MELVIKLIVMAVFGTVCALIAHSRGRTPVGWFFVGLIAPCLGLILVLVLPDLKVEAERHSRLEQQNRRLRERISKDRQVADRRHLEAARRLTVHDRALGVDTGDSIAAGASNPALAPPPAPEREPESSANWTRAGWTEASWHYLAGSDDRGPVGFQDLRRLWREGDIGAATLVWTSGLEDWKALADVPELEDALRA